VQEEIRFAICPENIVSMLFCPVMTKVEAIQIIGAEQFSDYAGYMFSFRFAGPYLDPSPLREDGTVRQAIAAIDAYDGRGRSRKTAPEQMSQNMLLRELNKSFAGFQPVAGWEGDEIATGNWGCGVFGGFAELKALVQWASASHAGRRLRYYPFEQTFGPRLEALSTSLVAKGVTTGNLISALVRLSSRADHELRTGFLEQVGAMLDALPDAIAVGPAVAGAAASSGGSGGCDREQGGGDGGPSADHIAAAAAASEKR
jgi:poly(ADP-ribose) glycohydrolase